MTKKIELKFNPDSMTVSDLKAAAQTLRSILQVRARDPENWEEIGCAVAQCADIYQVD